MTTFMHVCTALEKTRYKKHGQAILFFHRNFSDGCAILYAFPFSRNECQMINPFPRNEYAIIVQSQNFREVSHFIAALIFFPPHGLSFGINRYRAGAKVWQRALEIKGQAYGFRKNLHAVG